eukprot:Amastigsp_a679145_59.p4 type:complete len:114 gc:universal Amastigsp_a679145_59:556-897(+)
MLRTARSPRPSRSLTPHPSRRNGGTLRMTASASSTTSSMSCGGRASPSLRDQSSAELILPTKPIRWRCTQRSPSPPWSGTTLSLRSTLLRRGVWGSPSRKPLFSWLARRQGSW